MTTHRAQSICKRQGCGMLLPSPGYCAKHTTTAPVVGFRALDARKSPETVAFYRNVRWTRTSRQHRAHHPLCKRCEALGLTVAGELVHHNPPLVELLRTGKDPYAPEYLETQCTRCHLNELRALRG